MNFRQALPSALLLFLLNTSVAAIAAPAVITPEIKTALVNYTNTALLSIIDNGRENFECTPQMLKQMDDNMTLQMHGMVEGTDPAIIIDLPTQTEVKLKAVLLMKTPEYKKLMRLMFPKPTASSIAVKKCLADLEATLRN